MKLEEFYKHPQIIQNWTLVIDSGDLSRITSFINEYPNIVNLLIPFGPVYATALYLASQGGKVDVVKLLLSQGADTGIPTFIDGMEYVPAMKAFVNGHFTVFNELATNKAKLGKIKDLDIENAGISSAKWW